MADYQFDSLGWYRFERLCQSLLQAAHGLGIECWGGTGDGGRDAYTTDALAFPGRRVQPGPFLFQVKFVENAVALGPTKASTRLVGRVTAEAEEIAKRKKAGSWPDVACYCVLSNAPLSASARADVEAELRPVLGAEARVVTLGATEVAGLVQQHPALRTAYPELLGLGDLRALIADAVNHGIRVRSQMLLRIAADQATRFEPTAAYHGALAVLERSPYLLLTGPPEFGKTTIARIIALARAAEEWQVVDCADPDDVFDTHDPDHPQLFVADDAFGTTEYDPELADRWARQLEPVLHLLDDRHQLIWTSRSTPFQRALERLRSKLGRLEAWPEAARVTVDPSGLSPDERAMILYGQAKAAGLDARARAAVQAHAEALSDEPHFTPERIRRLVDGRLQAVLAEHPATPVEQLGGRLRAELSQATARMQTSFAQLDEDARLTLIALLDSSRAVTTRAQLAGLVARHAGERSIDLDRTLELLEEQFLTMSVDRGEPGLIAFVHPSWRDLVIDHLRAHRGDRRAFLARCGIAGVALAMSLGGGADGGRRLPLLRDAADWEVWGDRFAELVMEHDGEEREERREIDALLVALLDAARASAGRDREQMAGTVPRILLEYVDGWPSWPLAVDPNHVEALLRLTRLAGLDADARLGEVWEALGLEAADAVAGGRVISVLDLDVLVDWMRVTNALDELAPELLTTLRWPDGHAALGADLVAALEATAADLPEKPDGIFYADWRWSHVLIGLADFCRRHDLGDELDLFEALERHAAAHRHAEDDEELDHAERPVARSDAPARLDLRAVFSDL